MNLFRFQALLLLVGWFLGGCSSHPKVLTSPASPQTSPIGDSLRAKLEFTAYQPDGSEKTLKAMLFAVPRQRYRLEVSGPMGIGVSSLLWQPKAWIMLFPTKDQFATDEGDMIQVMGAPLPPLSIHTVFAPIWGEWFPSESDQVQTWTHDSLQIYAWNSNGQPRRLETSLRTGHPLRQVLNGSTEAQEIRVLYGDLLEYEVSDQHEKKILPGSMTYWIGNEKVFKVKLQEVRTDKTWGQGVWKLKKPQDWKQLLTIQSAE